jgi:hypothetical protein
MVAECSKADTGVGPSWHRVTMDVKTLCRFSTAAKIKSKLRFYCREDIEKMLFQHVQIEDK